MNEAQTILFNLGGRALGCAYGVGFKEAKNRRGNPGTPGKKLAEQYRKATTHVRSAKQTNFPSKGRV